MSVRDVCHQTLLSIDQAAPAEEAARLMRRHHVGALAVTAAAEGTPRVVGIVTDRDLALDVLGREPGAGPVPVGQVAQRELVAVPAAAELAQAVLTMQQHGVRRLLVVEADGRLLGLVSFDDVIEALAQQLAMLAGALRKGIERETRTRGTPQPARPGPVFLPMGTPGMH